MYDIVEWLSYDVYSMHCKKNMNKNSNGISQLLEIILTHLDSNNSNAGTVHYAFWGMKDALLLGKKMNEITWE